MQRYQKTAIAGAVVAVLAAVAIPEIRNSFNAPHPESAEPISSAPARTAAPDTRLSPPAESSVVRQHTGFDTNDFTSEQLAQITSAPAGGSNVKTFGKFFPFTLDELPDSKLRRDLVALEPIARERAMETLGDMNFTIHELEFIQVTRDGNVFFVDSFRGLPTQEPEENNAADIAHMTSGDVFNLNSKPGSKNVIYLDFDGHVIENTYWNSSYGVSRWVATPYDRDNNPNSFGESELVSIYNIWRRVAEDYSPFDVNVTTAEPAQFDDYTVRALFTEKTDANGEYLPSGQSSGVAGIAFVGAVGRSDNHKLQPALVYYYNTASYGALVASHEIGHNMGLSHDGYGSQSYYSGHGAGEESWGPIMGTPYPRNLRHWSNGDYSGATNQEDDVSIMLQKLGGVDDLHSSQRSGATALVADSDGNVKTTIRLDDPDNINPDNKGHLNYRGDVDVFGFDSNGGFMSLSAFPMDGGLGANGNVNLELTLTDAQGNVLAQANPETEVSAGIKTTIGSGRHYLSVRGTGNGNVAYSDYGVLGAYYIQGVIPASGDTGTADTAPPSPNPMSFAANPSALSHDRFEMTAATASDPGGVQYAFENTCSSNQWSSWQNGPDYTISGFLSNTRCGFRVKARDGAGNETQPSQRFYATTMDQPTDNCPTSVRSHDFMYDYDNRLVPNSCVTDGTMCSGTYFESSGVTTTANCDGGIWKEYEDNSNNGGDDDSGGDNTDPNAPSACPRGVFDSGYMYDAYLKFVPNTCNPVGGICDSVYFYGLRQYTEATCTVDGWVSTQDPVEPEQPEEPEEPTDGGNGDDSNGGNNGGNTGIESCPQRIFPNGEMFRHGEGRIDNSCYTAGKLCKSVYFRKYRAFAPARCDGSSFTLDLKANVGIVKRVNARKSRRKARRDARRSSRELSRQQSMLEPARQ